MSAPLPVGILGLGKHGSRYLAHLRRDLPDVYQVVALARRDEALGRDTAAEIGAAFHDSVEGAIADAGVRAVISVLPPTENRRVVEACAAAGKPLLLEKPFAATLADAVAEHDALVRSGIPCMIAQTLRWNGVITELRPWLARIGRVHQVAIGQTFEPSPLAWLDIPAVSGGGMILHTGVHMFDLARWLTGAEVDRVSCWTGQVETRSTEDEFVANLEMSAPSCGRILVSVAGSRATRSRTGPLRLVGTAGQIVADHVRRELAVVHGQTTETPRRPPDVSTILEVLRAFHPVATAGAPSPVPPEEGVRSIAVVDACYRSAAAGGAPVAIDRAGQGPRAGVAGTGGGEVGG